MTSCSILFQLPQGWRHWSGQRCKKALSTFVWRNFWCIFKHRDKIAFWRQSHGVCHHIAASRVKPRVSNVGAWPARWMDWGGPTCCLSHALIRIRCEWTWHCDMKGFHSLHVTSSYCINMPLMFHSDTGLLWCTSPKTNSSDKCTWLPCHDG